MAESSLTHIDGLPTEVLSLILTTVVGASLYARSVGDKSYGSVDCPTLLASVCARWRRIAIGIPVLWSFIDLARSSDSLGNIEHAKLYVERSQDSPVYIQLGKLPESRPRLTSPTRKVSENMLSLLRTVAPRVQSFSLSFSHSQDATEALSIFLSQVVEHPLAELALRLEPSIMGGLHRSLVLDERWDQLFGPLNALYLDRLPMDPRYLSCRNLVELHMTSLSTDLAASAGPTIVQIKQLLNNNPNLRAVTLSGSLPVPASIDTQQIHLPALRLLDLGYIDDTFINWLLASLVPGSHELELYLNSSRLHRVDKTTFENTLIAFFQRALVKSLYISGRWILLPPILAHIPHLQRLSLSVYDFDQDTLDGIEGLASTLANLRTIELNECNMHSYSQLDRGLKTLLTFPSVQQIKHFRCGDGLAPGVRERFRKLLEDQDITAKIIEAPELGDKMRPSPFR
ncbi:hypothetical protein FRC08_006358 [Ceratobasidium sp. 394]|nr:hypothetical protein FRC08_006358 [Ceratobasidium sp. 394]